MRHKYTPFTPEQIAAHRAKHIEEKAKAKSTLDRVNRAESIVSVIFIMGGLVGIFLLAATISSFDKETTTWVVVGYVAMFAMAYAFYHHKEKQARPYKEILRELKEKPIHTSLYTKKSYEEVLSMSNQINYGTPEAKPFIFLAQCHNEGCFFPKDKKHGALLLAAAGDRGDVDAMLSLAEIFESGGKEIEINKQMAYEWYQKAKSKGSLRGAQKTLEMEHALVTKVIESKIEEEAQSIRQKSGGNASALGVGILLGVAIS